MKQGDKVTLYNDKNRTKFHIQINRIEGHGIYGNIIDPDPSTPWLQCEYYFDMAPGGFIQYRVLEDKPIDPCMVCGEKLESCGKCKDVIPLSGIITTMNGLNGTVKFNAASLQPVTATTELKSYTDIDLSLIPIVLGYAKKEDIQEILNEFNQAYYKYNDFASFHEGYAVMWEEVEEYWHHVTIKEKERDMVAMRKELIQVAAMALKNLHLFHKENK